MIYKHLKSYKSVANTVHVTFSDMCDVDTYVVIFPNTKLTASQIASWVKGTDISIAMPNLTQRERDMFVTGIRPEDYSKFDRQFIPSNSQNDEPDFQDFSNSENNGLSEESI
jgi:hypothetical protein